VGQEPGQIVGDAFGEGLRGPAVVCEGEDGQAALGRGRLFGSHERFTDKSVSAAVQGFEVGGRPRRVTEGSADLLQTRVQPEVEPHEHV
jgi:hypothetical protein